MPRQNKNAICIHKALAPRIVDPTDFVYPTIRLRIQKSKITVCSCHLPLIATSTKNMINKKPPKKLWESHLAYVEMLHDIGLTEANKPAHGHTHTSPTMIRSRKNFILYRTSPKVSITDNLERLECSAQVYAQSLDLPPPPSKHLPMFQKRCCGKPMRRGPDLSQTYQVTNPQ